MSCQTGRLIRRWFVPSLTVPMFVFAFLTQGCGSSSPTSPTVTPTPAPQTVAVLSGSLTNVQPSTEYAIPFQTGATGTIQVTLAWTFPSTTMQVAFASGNCLTIACATPQAGQFGTSSPGSTTITYTASAPQSAGTYSVLFNVSGNQTEAISYNISLVTS